MITKLARISKFGVQLEGSSDWKNLSKFDPIDLSKFNAGDVVDIVLAKDKYIKSLVHASDSNANQGEPMTTNTSSHTSSNSSSSKSGFSTEISARQTVVNASLGSVDLNQLLELTTRDKSEAVDTLEKFMDRQARWILTGSRAVTAEGVLN